MIERIDFEERKLIERYIKQGRPGSEIAEMLCRSRNGINTEIRNNGGRERYTAEKAQERYESVRKLQSESVSEKLKGHKDSFGWKERVEALEAGIINLSLEIEKLKKAKGY